MARLGNIFYSVLLAIARSVSSQVHARAQKSPSYAKTDLNTNFFTARLNVSLNSLSLVPSLRIWRLGGRHAASYDWSKGLYAPALRLTIPNVA